jgi:hypothetical protein
MTDDRPLEVGSRTRRRPMGRDYAAAQMRKWGKKEGGKVRLNQGRGQIFEVGLRRAQSK